MSSPVRNGRGDTLRYIGLVLVLAVAFQSLGCSDSRADRAGVSGEVTFDGTPVSEGTVSFVPAEGTIGPLTGGNIVNGRYEIPVREGPLPGNYRVDVTAYRKTGKKMPNLAGELTVDELEPVLPEKKYNGPTSTLQAEIKSGDNVHDFKLTSN